MDEILEKFETSLETRDGNAESKNFEGLYKNWGRYGNQEERRTELLEVQKRNRFNNIDQSRGILDMVSDSLEDNLFNQKNTACYKPNSYVAGFTKATTTYTNILMLSEWLVEKPKDFHENWYVVSCPKAKRVLVVANKGKTKCYAKYGNFLFQRLSALPGGHPYETKKRNRCCILDCFYLEQNNTMYVLDILAWNNQTMTDGETEFRHYWLENELEEIPQLKEISKTNEMIFTLLPKVSCSKEEFKEFMMKFPPFQCNFPHRDGLLFYHKKATYVSGETPLVGWLYPFMVPEILGEDIPIHRMYSIEKPVDYVDQTDFISNFEEKAANRLRRSKYSSVTIFPPTMDVTENKQNPDDDNTKDSEVMEAEENKNSDAMEAEDVNNKGEEISGSKKSSFKKNTDNELMDADEAGRSNTEQQ